LQLRKTSSILPAALLVLALGSGCGGPEKGHGYVARVNNAVLTQEDLVVTRDSLGAPTALSKEYVNEWIVNELLFQEAERRGVPDGKDFQEQLEKTRKRLAVAALLQQEVYGAVDTASITDATIEESFKASGNAYALREDLVRASLVLFRDRDAATNFRTTVLRGTTWDEALGRVAAVPAQQAQILRTADHRYLTRATLYPEELWRLARSLPREEVSFPLRSSEGYYILRVHQSFRLGELPPLEYVRAEVREHLLMDLRRQRFEDFIRTLHERHAVDIRDAGADSGAVQE
jgi:peptidyl-prolyl cis-trans isomerase C